MTIRNDSAARPTLIVLRGMLALLFAVVMTTAHAACSITQPDGWAKSTTVWDGECKGGQAHGLGVLKEFDAQKKTVVRFFFGQASHGAIALGVIDQADGYVAGSFKDGKVIESTERQATISAFKEATSAAKLVAARYRKSGNLASARFYDAKTKQLSEQMD